MPVNGVYLAGPIMGCTDAECVDWRKEIIEHFAIDIVAFDPMVRDYRGQEGDFYREIVEGDKEDLDMCQVVVVNYIKPSVGTSMEILYGWERGKVIILVTREGEVLSPWLRYHCQAITHTYREAACLVNKLFGE